MHIEEGGQEDKSSLERFWKNTLFFLIQNLDCLRFLVILTYSDPFFLRQKRMSKTKNCRKYWIIPPPSQILGVNIYGNSSAMFLKSQQCLTIGSYLLRSHLLKPKNLTQEVTNAIKGANEGNRFVGSTREQSNDLCWNDWEQKFVCFLIGRRVLLLLIFCVFRTTASIL